MEYLHIIYILFTGPLIFIQLANITETIDLDIVPITFPDMIGNADKFSILGVVRYVNKKMQKGCNLGTIGPGHYTCIAHRNKEWYEINDLRGGEMNVLKTKKEKQLNCEFLIYVKTTNWGFYDFQLNMHQKFVIIKWFISRKNYLN